MPDMQRLSVVLRARFLAGFILLLSVQISRAGSATWNSSPATNDWNTNGNWTPNTGYPNGSTDTATFALSSTTGVSISANTDVGSITFTSAATNPYTITVSPTFILTVHAPGIANNSGITQNFVTPNDGAGGVGAIFFILGASAGNMMTFTNSGTSFLGGAGGFARFENNSTAGSATFINNGGTGSSGGGGVVSFNDTSTAASGTYTNNGGTVSNAVGGSIQFFNTATAANGLFTNNAGAVGTASGG